MSTSLNAPRAGASAIPRTDRPRWAWPGLMAGLFALAFVARLVPLLNGGGFRGLGNYDDGVHYAAAVGLVHGLLPYRDFLLLQPPGIVLLLTPFALLGRLAGDPAGMAAGRLAFMAVGSLTACLVARYLRSLGWLAAIIGGLYYALFLPASYTERSTLLEGPGNTLLVVALLLLSRSRAARARKNLLITLAGVALGLSVAVKIWAIVPALLIAGWLWLTRSGRAGLRVLIAAGVTGAVIAAPFLVAAPRTMWEMVVSDQVGRRYTGTIAERFVDLEGLSRWDPHSHVSLPLILTTIGLLAALGLAFTVARVRLPAVLLLADVAVLLWTPSAFLHYGALVAVPTALVVGGAVARLVALVAAAVRPGTPRRIATAALGLVLVAGLVVWAAPLASDTFGERFPADRLRPAVAAAPGCVATDDPGTLIQLDVLGRNISRGCPYVVDLGGASYHPPLIAPGPRNRNAGWQRYALGYLRDADLVIIARFRSGFGFDKATAAEVNRWPVVERAGRFRVRAPAPAG